MNNKIVVAALGLVAPRFSSKRRRSTIKSKKRQNEKRQQCTPGIYKQTGENGHIRFGESGCIEKRVPRSAQENSACLGKLKKVELLKREPDRLLRRAFERNEIQRVRASTPEILCNRVDR
jgi:hypothetical protein